MKKGFKGVLALGGAAIGSGALYKGAKYISNKRRHKEESLKIEEETQRMSPKVEALLQAIGDVTGRKILLLANSERLPSGWIEAEVDEATTEFLITLGVISKEYKAYFKVR